MALWIQHQRWPQRIRADKTTEDVENEISDSWSSWFSFSFYNATLGARWWKETYQYRSIWSDWPPRAPHHNDSGHPRQHMPAATRLAHHELPHCTGSDLGSHTGTVLEVEEETICLGCNVDRGVALVDLLCYCCRLTATNLCRQVYAPFVS